MPERDGEPIIMPRDDGPYLVLGEVSLIDVEGMAIHYEGRMAICRCGNSGTKPICDGSHRDNGFESVIRG